MNIKNTPMRLSEISLNPFKPHPDQQRLNNLTKRSVQLWTAQKYRLTQAGINLNDPDVLKTQFNAWATKFFKAPTPITADVTRANTNATVQQIVGRKLAGVDINTGQPLNMEQPTTPNQTGQTQPAARPVITPEYYSKIPAINRKQNGHNFVPPAQSRGPQAPANASVVANGGKYTKTAQGWANENGEAITKPQTIQWLENQYTNSQNHQGRP